METRRKLVLWISVLMACLTNSWVEAAPVKIRFDGCKPGRVMGGQGEIGPLMHCCPPMPTGPIVDFVPVRNMSKPLRVRKALQCLEGEELEIYVEKLRKAYAIMRSFPDDDPRSLEQHRRVHCAHSTGAFNCEGQGVDIHFGWLFYPFHRFFLYFHERMLQTFLGDPDFTLHFWNWDNAGQGGCGKPGDIIPPMYADRNHRSTYHLSRSNRTYDPELVVDLWVDAWNETRLPGGFSKEVTKARNLETMHWSMITMKDAPAGYSGRVYRAGYPRVTPYVGAGTLEVSAHGALHKWVGIDMDDFSFAAGDPLFYPHHENIDRLWDVWHNLSPNNTYPTDPDFLDAEFLFYDENLVLRRMWARDTLDMTNFGYTYEAVDNVEWLTQGKGDAGVAPPADEMPGYLDDLSASDGKKERSFLLRRLRE